MFISFANSINFRFSSASLLVPIPLLPPLSLRRYRVTGRAKARIHERVRPVGAPGHAPDPGIRAVRPAPRRHQAQLIVDIIPIYWLIKIIFTE